MKEAKIITSKHMMKECKMQSLGLHKNSGCQEGFKRLSTLHKHEDE